MKTIISLGANLGDREKNLTSAISIIAQQIGPVLAQSEFYDNEAMVAPDNDGAADQPNFINACILVETDSEPEEILAILLGIEQQLGRDRNQEDSRWAPRLIDLDIIAIDDLVVNTGHCIIPHPEMHQRNFVLQPMHDILPEWQHPILKKSVAELLQQVPVLELDPA